MVQRALILAAALFSSDAVETRVQKPRGWVQGSRTNQDQVIELIFAVKQQGKQELHDALMRVSMPSSPDYGQHLSNEEVHQMTAPDTAHVEAVMSFIRAHGGEPVAATPNRDMITAKVTVESAERMLSARYHQHLHSSGKEIHRVADGYSLPDEVALAVDFVSPTVHFPGVRRPRQPSKLGSEVSDDSDLNTPTALRQLYNIDAEGAATGNRQAVTAFLENGYDDNALKKFWTRYCDGINCGKGEVSLVGDATDPGKGTESMLDIETITGIAGNIDSEMWSFGGRSPDNAENEPFMKWLAQVSSTSDDTVPKIFSTSYGEDENSWSFEAASRLNVEFQKAGARGISLLYASGDEGANCQSGGVPIGSELDFVPEGPGSSPYVTSVGGTQPADGWPAPGSETAVGLSSGGFSNYWDMPDWQKDAVAKYLIQDGIPDQSMRHYNASGRGYPDISVQAVNYPLIEVLPLIASGTSAASPAAAGIFSLLNDARLQAGQSTMGFLNPFIYENAAAFNDITTGSGDGCGMAAPGWPAKEGWDAVTGVGTPDYSKLAKLAVQLPAGKAQSIVV
jgi:tripeptidyl-peptidase-1